jgi:hypothetical protein
MMTLSSKKNKPINVKNKVFKKPKVKSHSRGKIKTNPRQKAPPDELLELAETWDEDLCE